MKVILQQSGHDAEGTRPYLRKTHYFEDVDGVKKEKRQIVKPVGDLRRPKSATNL